MTTRIIRIKTAASLAMLCAVAATPLQPAEAFGTADLYPWAGEHRHITRFALRSEGFGLRTLDLLAGTGGVSGDTYGAVGAPDRLTSPLGDVHEAHCDHGDYLAVPNYPQSAAQAQANLTLCRKWISDALGRATTLSARLVNSSGVVQLSEAATAPLCKFDDTAERAKCEVLEQLGMALHASQDFYAHTNWVDQPAAGAVSPDNAPGLGQSGAAPWLSLRQSVAFPTGLISGCYEGKPETTKCRYGPLTNRVKHDYLNKDIGPITDAAGATGDGGSTRGAINGNFRRAVAAASADTTDKWRLFSEQVKAAYPGARGAKIVCVIRSDNPAQC